MNRYAYSAPGNVRPEQWPNLVKEASKPYMGLTAFVAGQPRLVVGFDGKNYQLEGLDGSTVSLSEFVWDEANITENNMLVAASRIASSPFASGRIVNGATVGKLAYDAELGTWAVLAEEEGATKSLSLMSLIDQLEANGWQIEEEVIYQPGESLPVEPEAVAEIEPTLETAASTDHEAAHPAENEPLVCPKCGGHTLEHLDIKASGKAKVRCHACGEESVVHIVAPKKQSRIHDTDGRDLIEGKWYTMLSPKYKVPDTVRLVRILEDEIHAAASTEDTAVPITLKLADIDEEGYTFEPLIVEPEDSHIDAHVALQVLARRSFSPSQQRELIEEDGVARNASKMNLEGTHYHTAPEGTEGDLGIFFLW